ncbi:uncharacterized protein LOC121633192 [Melanotaenia boesemani]|uniref:uncharacterized protein LOC121633192 n=1 Tax=Melanotaenia boesemani TaxID=1250792 RepID=UPI001C049C9C|nr:uncharacterized protein LOC121633192 [Melanotaenia boesemani]
MDFHMCSRKHPLFDDHEEQFPLYRKRHLRNWSDRVLQHNSLTASCSHSCMCEACVNRRTNHPTACTRLSEQTTSWANTQNSVKKVLEHLKSKQTTDCIFLDDSVNSKFLAFHRDITDECGAEDKQHSWGVIEKQEEIIMYGPYYPNYNNGEHSEDIIVKQTQEFLESGDTSEDWKVYVFTVNSPCLARNTEPCMLTLVHKAQEWWRLYRVKTHIGFIRCWGFKGTKENLYKDINYRQVECINQSANYESYVKVSEKITDLNPLCKSVFYIAKHLLESGQENFSLISTVQKQDWRSYFKTMSSIFESKPEDEKNLLTQELNTSFEAAEVLLSGKTESFEQYLERGRTFTLSYAFSSLVCDAVQTEMRLRFEQCWREMVQDKYAEFIREKLTDEFNQCTIHLFIKDILQFTEMYLKIGKLQF